MVQERRKIALCVIAIDFGEGRAKKLEPQLGLDFWSKARQTWELGLWSGA